MGISWMLVKPATGENFLTYAMVHFLNKSDQIERKLFLVVTLEFGYLNLPQNSLQQPKIGGLLRAKMRAYSKPVPPSPLARICTHFADPPPPIAACVLYQ